MALIMLGVSFDPSAVRAKRRDIVICVFGRLIAVPAIGLPLAAAMGFRLKKRYVRGERWQTEVFLK